MEDWLEIKVRVALDDPHGANDLIGRIGDAIGPDNDGRWFMTSQVLGPDRGDVVGGLLRELWRMQPAHPPGGRIDVPRP